MTSTVACKWLHFELAQEGGMPLATNKDDRLPVSWAATLPTLGAATGDASPPFASTTCEDEKGVMVHHLQMDE